MNEIFRVQAQVTHPYEGNPDAAEITSDVPNSTERYRYVVDATLEETQALLTASFVTAVFKTEANDTIRILGFTCSEAPPEEENKKSDNVFSIGTLGK